jgi:hypothetical protein
MKNNAKRILALTGMGLLLSVNANAQTTLFKSTTEDQNEWEAYTKGCVQADFGVNFQEITALEGFGAQTIVTPQRNVLSTGFSVKQSTFGLGIKQKYSEGGDNMSAYVEFDLNGPNGTTAPHFRKAYVTYRNWLVGHNDSNVTDSEISNSIFDAVGPDGQLANRRIQIRYTTQIAPKHKLSFSLEDPNTPSFTLPVDSLNWKKRAIIPTLTGMYRYGNEKNYIKMGGILTPITYDLRYSTAEAFRTKTIVGWGAMVSGTVHTKGKNHLSAQSSYGKGFATNNSDLNGGSYDAIPNPNNANLLETLPLFNFVAIYEHYWNDKWLTTGTISHSRVVNVDFVPKDFSRDFNNAILTVAYKPFKNLTMGVEGNYGYNENFGKQYANGWRVQASTRLSF